MEWSKLKNIVLLLLAVTNLCLLAFVIHREWREEQQLREARAQAITFLQQRGVQMDEERVPEKTNLAAQTVEREQEMEQAGAAALLGEDMQSSEHSGGIRRYESGKGFVQFHGDGSFSAEFSSGAFPLGEDREKSCRELLEKLGFQWELLSTEEDRLTFRQKWKGAPLFDQRATLVCSGDCITAITGGKRLMGEPAADEGGQPITAATALFDFYNGLGALGDVCSRVDRIETGYVSTVGLAGPFTLTPVWRIHTNTGRYQLDALSGGLSRLP